MKNIAGVMCELRRALLEMLVHLKMVNLKTCQQQYSQNKTMPLKWAMAKKVTFMNDWTKALENEAEQQRAYLIFVTDPTDISVEKKFVMWRNFRFLCMTDMENSEISPQVE